LVYKAGGETDQLCKFGLGMVVCVVFEVHTVNVALLNLCRKHCFSRQVEN
jgi:hypothetical protein